MNDTPPSRCGCCEGLEAPPAVRNDPGLPALRYRVDTQPGFHARMLQSLPFVPADPQLPGAPRPLAALLTRSPDDPTVALLDAAACVADVLTFYQERIANEGFLRTATETRSVRELARTIGYEPRPGVAAGVHLAFTVEDAPGAPGVCTLAAGTPVQSVPAQGKLPQVFETSRELVARAEWNALVPRQRRPADMAILDLPAGEAGAASMRKALMLLGPGGSFPPGTPGLHARLRSDELFRLDPALAARAPVGSRFDAIEIGSVYFTDATTGIAAGDLLLFVGRLGTALAKLVLRVEAVTAEPALRRLRVDVAPLPDAQQPVAAAAAASRVPYATRPVAAFAQAQASPVAFTGSQLTATVVHQAWRESDLQAMIGIQGWSAARLLRALQIAPPEAPGRSAVAPGAGVYAFGARLGFFGHNGPKWATLPATNTRGEAYRDGWDKGDPFGVVPRPALAAQRPLQTDSQGRPLKPGTSVAADAFLERPGPDPDPRPRLTAQRTIWTDSQDQPLLLDNGVAVSAFLERPVPNLGRGGWVVFDAPEAAPQVSAVFDAREAARADYGLSGRAMAITLAGDDGRPLGPQTAAFPFRSTTAHVASRRLVPADLPIEAPVGPGDTPIELDAMVLGLSVGQPIALAGTRADLPGVEAAEIAILREIVHADGRTTLVLEKPLACGYVRSSLRICANVVHATHGETVHEVLGNGEASVPNQAFVLSKPMTTHLPAPTPAGVASTLEVRVNGVRWDEAGSLYGQGPGDTVYATRIDDEGRMTLSFGDGVRGARLPTGAVNVVARYRSGLGPDGEVEAGSLTMLRAMPLGLRGVTNPVPARGAQGPEQLKNARRNAPLTLLSFERVVSRLDYQDYARAYPGIGKARADVLWIDGAETVFLTVAGATGGAPGEEALKNLRLSIAAASDPSQRFAVAALVQRYFRLDAQIAVDPRHRFAELRTAIGAALLASFGFEARDLGQSVSAAEVMALIHGVPGVVAVDLVDLSPCSGAAPPGTVLDAVPAFGARHDPALRTQAPAELLLINPGGLSLTEMRP